MIDAASTIIILSPENWGKNKVSKHHYASLLATRGHKVYFVNPPSGRFGKEEVEPNLFIVDYKSIKGLNRLPLFIRSFFQRRIAQNMLQKLDIPFPDLVWSFDPFVFQYLECFGQKAFKIYHAVDDHKTHLETQCAKSADLLLAISDLIMEKFDDIDMPKFFLNHGLADHFVAYNYQPRPIDPKQIKVGLIGNLNYSYLDYPTLFKIVEKHPNVQFIFIGPYKVDNLSTRVLFEAEIERLKQYPNTELKGPIPSAELPAQLDQMDLFLICYKSGLNKRHMSNSHKVLEYLSTGKPIVCHYIDQYKNRPDLLTMADSTTELIQNFDARLNELKRQSTPDTHSAKRMNFAKQCSYRHQLDRILELIAKNEQSRHG